MCSLCMPCLACTLPPLSILVSVVFGTAIPTSLYIFGRCVLILGRATFLLYYSIVTEKLVKLVQLLISFIVVCTLFPCTITEEVAILG